METRWCASCSTPAKIDPDSNDYISNKVCAMCGSRVFNRQPVPHSLRLCNWFDRRVHHDDVDFLRSCGISPDGLPC